MNVHAFIAPVIYVSLLYGKSNLKLSATKSVVEKATEISFNL